LGARSRIRIDHRCGCSLFEIERLHTTIRDWCEQGGVVGGEIAGEGIAEGVSIHIAGCGVERCEIRDPRIAGFAID
jgi:hypothetical protein